MAVRPLPIEYILKRPDVKPTGAEVALLQKTNIAADEEAVVAVDDTLARRLPAPYIAIAFVAVLVPIICSSVDPLATDDTESAEMLDNCVARRSVGSPSDMPRAKILDSTLAYDPRAYGAPPEVVSRLVPL